MAQGACRNRGLSGAAKRLARKEAHLKAHIGNHVLSLDNEHREIAVSYQHILYEVSEKIATITLHRPDRMNAWTPIMEGDVRHAMEAAAADENVRVIVLTGAGRAFSAGADMDALKSLDPDDIRRAETGVPPLHIHLRPHRHTAHDDYPPL